MQIQLGQINKRFNANYNQIITIHPPMFVLEIFPFL